MDAPGENPMQAQGQHATPAQKGPSQPAGSKPKPFSLTSYSDHHSTGKIKYIVILILEILAIPM